MTDTVDAARSEVAALLSLAARGAGLPAGLAPDFVAAALRLLPHDPLADLGTAATLTVDGSVRQGKLAWLAPSAADFIEMGHSVDLSPAPPLFDAYLASRGLSDSPPPEPARLAVPRAVWARLQDAAKLTYVPDSALSRRGAGSARDGD